MTADAVSAVAAIRELRSRWAGYFNTDRIDELGELFYTADAYALPPEHELVSGREAIIRFLKEARAAGAVSSHLDVIDCVSSGELGYVVGTFSFTTRDAGESHGLTLETYRREPDGFWRCAVDMWHPAAF